MQSEIPPTRGLITDPPNSAQTPSPYTAAWKIEVQVKIQELRN